MCVLKAQRIVQYAFQIATAVHDADNSHFTGRFMDKIENSVVIYDQLTHTHGKPRLPVDTGMAGGELFQLANCIADSDSRRSPVPEALWRCRYRRQTNRLWQRASKPRCKCPSDAKLLRKRVVDLIRCEASLIEGFHALAQFGVQLLLRHPADGGWRFGRNTRGEWKTIMENNLAIGHLDKRRRCDSQLCQNGLGVFLQLCVILA